MNKEEMLAVVQPIIEAGFAADKDDNQIKGEMLAAGLDFGKINPLFKEVSIDLGLIADPAEVTKSVNELVAKIDWESVEDYPALEKIVDQICAAVEGAKSARVLTLARAFAKGEEIELPKKSRTGGGGPRTSKVAVAVVELINTNPAPTKQDFYDAVYPVVGGDKRSSNCLYYMNLYFAVCLAVKNNTSLEDVGASLKAMADVVEIADDVEVEADDDADEDEYDEDDME